VAMLLIERCFWLILTGCHSVGSERRSKERWCDLLDACFEVYIGGEERGAILRLFENRIWSLDENGHLVYKSRRIAGLRVHVGF
jgi:hypothetical protein